MKKIACLVITSGLFIQPALADNVFFEASGKVSTEVTIYAHEGQFAYQDYQTNLSLAVEPAFYWDWNGQQDSLTFKPFFRKDQRDEARTHADIRELNWVHLTDDWELRSGVRRVFWGVTEFQNLVDVINQKDAVEGLDKEHKLGQPMINLSLVKDWGIIDIYVLPGFRQQTSAGVNGRLRAGLVIDADTTTYDASNQDQHIDLAARWGHAIGAYDVGAHWYKGTDRTPLYRPISVNGNNSLRAHYQAIEQVGLDVQATLGSWLWKAEVIHQTNPVEDFWASQLGAEYTFYGIQESATNLGVLLEYGKDQRGTRANSVMQNDVGIGTRLDLNDTQSTSMFAGLIYDLDFHTHSTSIAGSRRLGEDQTLSLEMQVFTSESSNDPTAIFARDDHIKLTLDTYF